MIPGRWPLSVAMLAVLVGCARDTDAGRRHFNAALAALEAGDLRRCEIEAEKAATFGEEPRMQGLRDFLRGNAAYAKGERAARLARRPEAGPPAFDRAVEAFTEASRWWRRAATRGPDWPAARRNAERAERRVIDLERARELARERARRKTAGGGGERPRLAPEPGEEGDAGASDLRDTEEVAPDPSRGELGSAQLRGLMKRLEIKEKEKRRSRRLRQRARRASGGKDW